MAGEGDAERLVVMLEARVRDFEKNMQKASGTATQSYGRMRRDSRSATRAMEADMTRSSTRINRALASTTAQIGVLGRTFAGAFAGGMFAGGLAGFARAARGIVSELSEMGKQIDRVGLSAKVFQELRFGFELAGVAQSEFSSGMEQFTKRIGEAATRGGRLAEIFKANGVALRDQAGNIRSNEALLRDYAELIKNAGSEQEKLLLATEAFGKGGVGFVNALKDGADGLDAMARAAEDAGGTIDEALIRKAEALDDRWAASWRKFEINAKSAIMNAISWLDDFIAKAEEAGNASIFKDAAKWLPSFGGADMTYLDPDLARSKGQDLGPDARIRDAFREGAGEALSEADAALVEELRKRYGAAADKAATTVIPGGGDGDDRTGRGGRGGGRNRAAEAALREAEAVTALIEQLSHELELIGATDVERDKVNALRRAGAAATDEQRQEIERLIDAIDRETQALKASQQATEFLRDAAGEAFRELVPAIETGNKALDSLINKLIEAAMQAALLGTGPLASLFGGGGGGGGIFGSLMSMFTGGMGGMGGMGGFGLYASGTADTGGRRGEPRGVVHGREAVIPLPSGGKVPVQIQGGEAAPVKVSVAVQSKVDVVSRFEADGGFQTAVSRVATPIARGEAATATRQLASAVPGMVDQRQGDSRERGIRA